MDKCVHTYIYLAYECSFMCTHIHLYSYSKGQEAERSTLSRFPNEF